MKTRACRSDEELKNLGYAVAVVRIVRELEGAREPVVYAGVEELTVKPLLPNCSSRNRFAGRGPAPLTRHLARGQNILISFSGMKLWLMPCRGEAAGRSRRARGWRCASCPPSVNMLSKTMKSFSAASS